MLLNEEFAECSERISMQRMCKYATSCFICIVGTISN